MVEDPQSFIVREKDKFAAVIYGHAGDPFERSYRVRVLRVRQVDQRTVSLCETTGSLRSADSLGV